MTARLTESFLATVDPEKATVVSFPEYIAVFGGAISRKIKKAKPKSQRDTFVKWISANRKELEELLIVPESYEDWSDFDTYSDLLLFERDLGCLTGAVLVFVETPGAIAELGAFSQIDSLSQRLLIVVTESRHPKKSFISLGPIRSVTETQKQLFSVCVIPDGKAETLVAHMHVVMGTLDDKRRRKTGSAVFNKDDPQHQILLVLDLINLFLVTTILEIQTLARHFGVELPLRRLNQILFTLQKTQLITSQHYGNTQYFVPKRFRNTYIDFTSKVGANSFNRERAKTERWSEIQADQYRKYAYALANKEAV